MGSGYSGRILRVDLGSGRISAEEPDAAFYRLYLGGKGFGTYFLTREIPGGADPLGPGNKLVFAVGPAAGAPLPGFARFTVAARSPLTGGYGEGEAGGFWGAELKRAGFDGIIVEGLAANPVYLWVYDGRAELREASHLWGRSTGATERAVREELGDDLVRVASIGPGGEKLVRYACIMHEGRNAVGRCGMGAVMGSKRLKAIAVRGTHRLELYDPGTVNKISRWFGQEYLQNPLTHSLHTLGTANLVAGLNAGSILPTRNFSAGQFEGWEAISGENLEQTVVQGKWGCFACPVRCKRAVAWPGWGESSRGSRGIAESPGETGTVAGPEYETLAAFGSNLGVSDVATIIRANWVCNEAGIDTISAGGTIALAMECYQRGLLTSRDTGGMDLRFGNAGVVVPLLLQITRREGLGDLLAEGARRLAEHLGGRALDFAVQVKGLELAMHDPRGKWGVGLGYAVAEHGGDHMTAVHDTMFIRQGSWGLEQAAPLGIWQSMEPQALGPDKVRAYFYLNLWWEALKALGVCFFCVAPRGLLPVNRVVEAVQAVTGWNISLWEILKVGERVGNLARIFNLREGFTPADDTLPPRLAESSGEMPRGLPGIPPAGLERAVAMYYRIKGWDERGRPGTAKLEELGIGWASGLLEKAGEGA